MSTTSPVPVAKERPPLWKVWLMAARPHTLTASIVPVLIGHFASAAFLHRPPSLTRKALFFSIFIQLGTNLHNDYADFVKGADSKMRVGHARATQRGWLTPRQTAGASAFCVSVALAIGLDLLLKQCPNDPAVWFVVVTSAFNAFAYTGGPFPLGYIGLSNVSIAYSGLGDLFCFVYFGLVGTLGTPYVEVRRQDSVTPFLVLFNGPLLKPCLHIALPVGFLATAILVVNNLRDRKTDVLAGKRTLAVRFGGTFCRVEYTLLVFASYVILLAHCFFHRHSWILLPFLTTAQAIFQVKAIWMKDGSDLNAHVGGTALLQLTFGVLLAIGLRKISFLG